LRKAREEEEGKKRKKVKDFSLVAKNQSGV
jgi:hypothetical protein